MTSQELYTTANDIAEDTIPETLFYRLLNVAKNKREDSRLWEFLKKMDSSKTASVGDTWATSKALPTDFRRDYKMLVGTDIEYFPVPFEQRIVYKDAARRYALDLANSVYYLTGSVSAAKTIYLFYIKTSPEFAVATKESEICVWPDRFQPLLAFDVAAMFQGGVDYDDISARMSPFNRQMAKELEASMIQWNTDLQLRAMNNSFAGHGEAAADLGLM